MASKLTPKQFCKEEGFFAGKNMYSGEYVAPQNDSPPRRVVDFQIYRLGNISGCLEAAGPCRDSRHAREGRA